MNNFAWAAIVNSIHPFYHVNERMVIEIKSKKIIPHQFYNYENARSPLILLDLISSKIIIPSSNRSSKNLKSNKIKLCGFILDNKLVSKRGFILVNGMKIDTMLIGEKKNIKNGSWVVFSNPNGGFYEEVVPRYFEILKNLSFNILLYNYPGVGSSEGISTPFSMFDTLEAMLRFLEDKKAGMNARNIIMWGISIGSGVLTGTLKNHSFNEKIQYLCVKEQTFHKLSQVPNRWFPNNLPLGGKVMTLLQWELNSYSDSSFPYPEVIIQKATCLYPQNPEQILDDGIIKPENSLAGFILQGQIKNKTVVGVGSNHCRQYSREEYTHIAENIKKYLD